MGNDIQNRKDTSKLCPDAQLAQDTIKDKKYGWVGDGWLYPYFFQEYYLIFREISSECQINGRCKISFSNLQYLLGYERHAAKAKFEALVKMGIIIDCGTGPNRTTIAKLDIDGLKILNGFLENLNKLGAKHLGIYLKERNIKEYGLEAFNRIGKDGKRKDKK